MESSNLEEVLSLGESYEGPDRMDDDDGIDSCTVLPCVGRGVNMINISEIKLPADYYADVQTPVQSVQASPKGKQSSGKGRAQLIDEDKIKCFRPGGNHMPKANDLPGGNGIPDGDYRPGESHIFVEHSLSQHTESQKGGIFDEDFPPLSGCISDKSSVTSDKSCTSLNSRGQQQPDSLKAIAERFNCSQQTTESTK